MIRLHFYIICLCSFFMVAACSSVPSSSPSPSYSSYSIEHDQKIERLENSYARQPNNTALALSLAKALRKADYLNRASRILEPIAFEEKSSADIKVEYAALQLAKNAPATAEDFGRAALKINPDHRSGIYILGQALEQQGKQDEARAHYQKTIETHPKSPASIYIALATLLAEDSDYQGAVDIMKKAQKEYSDHSGVQKNLRVFETLKSSVPSKTKSGTLFETPPKPPALVDQKRDN